VGFYYGTSSEPTSGDWMNATSSSFSLDLNGLKSNTKYYYRACVKVTGTGSYASQVDTFYGDVKSFTTPAESVDVPSNPAVNAGWLELPGAAGNQEYVLTTYDDGQGKARNYTFNYDKDMYTSLWVAYPLYSDTTVGDNSGSWKYTPGIPQDEQINITGGTSYGVNSGSTTTDGYDSNKEYYSRGHQIPNADRKSTATMNSQTYYTVNSTPQLQNGFNGSIWNTLEGAVRQQIPSSDTLYVVTGAAFQEKGAAEKPVTWIYPRGESSGNTGKRCPVPNFYWKALLKVRRNTAGAVTSASTIAFWFPHEDLRGKEYSAYTVSVASLQQMTGFDFFVNLPDSIENNAETNSDWETFTKF
jgi:endonuclease G